MEGDRPPCLITYTTINSKMDHRAKTAEFLEENSNKSLWLWIRHDTKNISNKIKEIDKLNMIKIKNFCAAEDTR